MLDIGYWTLDTGYWFIWGLVSCFLVACVLGFLSFVSWFLVGAAYLCSRS